MLGILLFIVFPVALLIVGGILIALCTGERGPDDRRRPASGGGFLDWML